MALHEAGEHTSAELAELFGVARSTVYRTIERVSAGAAERHAEPRRVPGRRVRAGGDSLVSPV